MEMMPPTENPLLQQKGGAPGGGGVLPYMGYTGMCGPKG